MYKIKFNNGLSIMPVSLFIELKEKLNILNVWDKAIEEGCRDVIFHGTLKELDNNVSELNFIVSRLISNMYHTSIIIPQLNNEDVLRELMANRLIVFFDSNVGNSTHFKHRVNLMKNLSKNDLIVLHPTSIKEFLFTRQYMINNEIKSKIMVKLDNFDKEELIENKIYDIEPYYGELYV